MSKTVVMAVGVVVGGGDAFIDGDTTSLPTMVELKNGIGVYIGGLSFQTRDSCEA